ncbi:unnamed protein product [Bursaphelenchus okinawaensis]|uniref:Uncharacterized protein n=1 Tax=Bursaphelenchus okinawaensis TaxID=465554 RepID=A0A811L5X9_9BILA|nr:unnamed protein product [Bursaphelenchus okinawaensis]CAG9118349.1 unnamed protein product [Bursaphelenchus okinawaensis]
MTKFTTEANTSIGVQNGGVQQRKPKWRKPTRQALQRHIALLQTKRRRQDDLPLLKRVLIQEEFEDKIFRLNNTSDESSDEDEPTTSAGSSGSSPASSSASSSSSSDSDSDGEDERPRYTLLKRSRFTIMSSRKKSKKGI